MDRYYVDGFRALSDRPMVSQTLAIYKADEVAEFMKRGLKYAPRHMVDCAHSIGKGCNCGLFEYLVELDRIIRGEEG